MAHIPINHPLRPLYRTLAALVGLYCLVFGVAGVVRTSADGIGTFQREGLPRVLNLPVNQAFAVVSIVVGLAVLVASVVGRNLDHYVDVAAGVTYLVVALAMMTLQRTDANVLGFTVGTCIVWLLFGLVTLMAGLYTKADAAGRAGTPADRPGDAGRARPSTASGSGGE